MRKILSYLLVTTMIISCFILSSCKFGKQTINYINAFSNVTEYVLTTQSVNNQGVCSITKETVSRNDNTYTIISEVKTPSPIGSESQYNIETNTFTKSINEYNQFVLDLSKITPTSNTNTEYKFSLSAVESYTIMSLKNIRDLQISIKLSKDLSMVENATITYTSEHKNLVTVTYDAKTV